MGEIDGATRRKLSMYVQSRLQDDGVSSKTHEAEAIQEVVKGYIQDVLDSLPSLDGLKVLSVDSGLDKDGLTVFNFKVWKPKAELTH